LLSPYLLASRHAPNHGLDGASLESAAREFIGINAGWSAFRSNAKLWIALLTAGGFAPHLVG
jgi:hypothetical protein